MAHKARTFKEEAKFWYGTHDDKALREILDYKEQTLTIIPSKNQERAQENILQDIDMVLTEMKSRGMSIPSTELRRASARRQATTNMIKAIRPTRTQNLKPPSKAKGRGHQPKSLTQESLNRGSR